MLLSIYISSISLSNFLCNCAKPAQHADFIFLTSAFLKGLCYCNNLTVSAFLPVSLLFAWLGLCQHLVTGAQPNALGRTKTPSNTKKSQLASPKNIHQ